ncbi:MAG: Ig domain-containing protein [Lachnospiraceae bacterium]|nr:Ig domain-containing protein [Lachnospiraceae bacterium]
MLRVHSDITFTVPAIGDDEPIITARRELGNAVREAREKMAAATEADYPQDVWKAFADAISEADAIRATGTLEEIQAAKQKLEQARKNFKTNAEIAKELEEKKKAEAVTNLNTAIDKKPEKAQADYTEASWTAYQKALTDAKNILANTNATADQITAAQKALETAFNGLQLKTQGSGNDDQQTSGPVKVSGIKFAASKYQIAAGKKINLGKEVTVSPKNAANKGLTWKTSNKKYATVSKTGVVTTKKAGAGKKVTITATAADGSKVSKKVTIQIMKNAVTKITLKASSKSVKAGKKVTVKASVRTNGKKVNKKLTWKSSNTKYATVNSKGVVTTKKAGKGKSVKITATATDGTNKKATITIKIKK